jgi:uracil-DNA glycosylase
MDPVLGNQQTRLEELNTIEAAIECDPNFDHLRNYGSRYVPGAGKALDPPIMFIGEAPGPNENAKGIPFYGRAGQIFNDLLSVIGYTRDDVYVTNIVKYMPTDKLHGKFRKPTKEEIDNSREHIANEIFVVDPIVVCLMGATSLQTIFPNETSISKVRGKFLEDSYGNSYYATYHPSFIQYPGNARYKVVMERDFRNLKNEVEKIQRQEA